MSAVRAAAVMAASALALACGCSPHSGEEEPVVGAERQETLRGPLRLLPVGVEAPDIEAEAHDGQTIDLGEMRGERVIVYFYARDFSPGCTAEAEGFREILPALRRAGCEIVGISTDALTSHAEFARAHRLRFPLISDPDGAIADAFGVSTTGGFAERVTFIVGADGMIEAVFPRPVVREHAREVLRACEND